MQGGGQKENEKNGIESKREKKRKKERDSGGKMEVEGKNALNPTRHDESQCCNNKFRVEKKIYMKNEKRI